MRAETDAPLDRPDQMLQLAAHLLGIGATDALQLVLELGERRLRWRREEVGDVGVHVRPEPFRWHHREQQGEIVTLDGFPGFLDPREV